MDGQVKLFNSLASLKSKAKISNNFNEFLVLLIQNIVAQDVQNINIKIWKQKMRN